MGKRAHPARKRPFLDISCSLIVDGLAVSRGGRRVFAEVGFRLGPGEAIELTGANGAGKSTLLRALAGLLPLEAGRVCMLPAAGADDTPAAERLHLLGPLDGLKTALTARENLAFAAELAGGGLPLKRGNSGAAGAVPPLLPLDALGRLGLGPVADLPVGYLSSGQRRRVAIGRLLVARRPLWLLDEPLNALDASAQETLGALVAEHRAGGGLVVVATHTPLGLPSARALRLSS